MILFIIPTSPWGFTEFNMAAVEGSLEEEALKRRERLKAIRKKSGLPGEQVSYMLRMFFKLSVLYDPSLHVDTDQIM